MSTAIRPDSPQTSLERLVGDARPRLYADGGGAMPHYGSREDAQNLVDEVISFTTELGRSLQPIPAWITASPRLELLGSFPLCLSGIPGVVDLADPLVDEKGDFCFLMHGQDATARISLELTLGHLRRESFDSVMKFGLTIRIMPLADSLTTGWTAIRLESDAIEGPLDLSAGYAIDRLKSVRSFAPFDDRWRSLIANVSFRRGDKTSPPSDRRSAQEHSPQHER